MISNAKPKWLVRTTKLLISLVVLSGTLLVGELFVRYFYPQRLYFNVSQWDPYVGFTAIPGIEGFSIHKDYTVHIKINRHGLRDREFSYIKPPDTVRIGIFGDSMTFGEGVQGDEAYPKVLERLLSNDEAIKKTGRQVEVLNFGIGKTATSHQLAWYQKEGKKYQLDIIILGFSSGNDFGGNWSGVFYLKDNILIHNPTAYSSIRKIQKIVYKIPFYRWLAANSHLVNLARKTVSIFDDNMRKKKSINLSKGKSENKNEIDAKVYNLTLRLIEEFNQETLEDNSQFIMVHIPAKRQHSSSAYSTQDKIKLDVIRTVALIKDLKKEDMLVLDLVPVFSDLPISKYYFENDGHMNKHGHEVVASNIYDAISPDVIRLLPKAATKQLQKTAVQ